MTLEKERERLCCGSSCSCPSLPLVLGPLVLAMMVFTGTLAEWTAVSPLLGIVLSVVIPANLPKGLLGYGLALGSAILGVFLIVAWKVLLWILILFMWAANS